MTTFRARTTAPVANDKNWTHYKYGGNNYCLRIIGSSVLPNCVGYAWGRWSEILGKFHKLSRANANQWYGNTRDGYQRSKTPRLGSVVCWDEGKYGHVAIVEGIYNDGTIIVSNSDYKGSRFYTRKFKPPYHFGDYKLQGFIHLPQTMSKLKSNAQMAADIWAGRDNWANFKGTARFNRLTNLGYNAAAVQSEINKIANAGKATVKKPVAKPTKKTNAQVASDIWNGKDGWRGLTGTKRFEELKRRGYDAAAVQAEINKIANNNSKKILRTPTQIANEIWTGKNNWGTGKERYDKLIAAGYSQSDINKIQSILNRK